MGGFFVAYRPRIIASMVQKLQMWLPGLILGLFGGRILGEWWQPSSVWIIVLLTLVLVIVAVGLLQKRPDSATWPLLFLALYVLSPEMNPSLAWLAAGVTAVSWLWGKFATRQWHVARYMIGPLLWLAFFLLYWQTLAAGLLPADNGEFQLVATQLGVAHPPGFPFYTLLAHAVTRLLPGATPAYQVNLLSALTSSLTLVMVYAVGYRLTHRHLAAVTGAIALGGATTFWAQATTANIRSLTALFAACMLYALVRFWELRREPDRSQADGWLTLFALALGWGVTHHASLLFMGLVFGVFALWVDSALFHQPRRWLRPLLAALTGLIPLLYLPLRAHSQAHGASPNLATWNGFLDHVLARGFSGDFFYFIEPSVLWMRLQVMANVLTFQFHPWLLAGMVGGLLWLLWQQRPWALLLGGSFLLHTFITATYRAPQTVEYMLPAYVSAAVTLSVAVGALLKGTEPGNKTVSNANLNILLRKLCLTLGSFLFVIAVAQIVHHFPSYLRLHADNNARDYAQPILEQTPAHTTVLADWHWATPLWYLQKVEGLRPDVEVRFVYPEAAPYAATWAQRIAAELAADRNVIATHFDENAYRDLPPAEPLHEAFLYRQEPLLSLPADFVPLNQVLGGAVRLLGYRVMTPAVEIGAETAVTLAWEPVSDIPSGLALFAHLVNASGQIVAQDDHQAPPQAAGIILTQFWLTPRLGTLPGPHTISVGAYTSGPLLNEAGNARTAVATLTVQAMSQPPYTAHPLHRPLVDEARMLIGYDWDTTLPGQKRLYLHWQTPVGFVTEVRDNLAPWELTLPSFVGAWGIPRTHWRLNAGWDNGRYVPFGQGVVWLGGTLTKLDTPVSLPQKFASSYPITRDLVVSVRLIGYQPDGVSWAWTAQDDGVPAMGAIPTLKWIAGSQVASPHRLPIDPKAIPGQQIGATLRLYDAFTNRPLPILDERITDRFPWVPLGQLNMPEE